jgi:hypothetical protein
MKTARRLPGSRSPAPSLTLSLCLTLLLTLSLTLPPRAADARVRSSFTSVVKDGMDLVLLDLFRKAEVRALAGRAGSIDVMVFSFTTRPLADEILRIAAAYPDLVKVRVMLDGAQMSNSETHMGPYLYHASRGEYGEACIGPCDDGTCEAACAESLQALLGGAKLPNLEVRYWFYDAWVWNAAKKMPAYSHSKGLLLHHKSAIVNRQILATGSYNWSASAAKSNYENLQVFSGTREQGVVSEFLAEFEAIWSDPERSVSTGEGQARKKVIWDDLYKAHGIEPD